MKGRDVSPGTNKSVIVIGGGIVGVSTALWLVRAGARVKLVDRNSIGSQSAASFGNAGVLAACSVAPVTAPGLVAKGPKLLLDPEFPLFLRWGYLPRLLPWLVNYLSHANDKDTRRIAAGLAPLTHDSVDQHIAMAKGTAAEAWIHTSDYAFVYPSKTAFEADSYTWDLRAAAGFVPSVIKGGAVQEFEPSLAENLQFLAVVKDHAFLGDPGKYLIALQNAAVSEGVQFVTAEAKDFRVEGGRVGAVLTDQGPFECDAAVVTAGVWSKSLAARLGIKTPLETERGYHIQFKKPSVGPRIPLMVTTGKFVATPMAEGLRCAGIVEFGGLEAPASDAPLALLKKKISATFPDLELNEATTWLGHRPAPPDSLPFIGEVEGTGIFTGFGHHHIGLTAGPKTGRILAGLIAGQHQNIDLSPYKLNRFGGGSGAHHEVRSGQQHGGNNVQNDKTRA